MLRSHSSNKDYKTEKRESTSHSNSLSNDDEISLIKVKTNSDEKTGLKYELKARHLSLMALAGIIGPGITVSASLALINGPAALLISFVVVGFVALCMMQSLGELVTTFPTGGTFSSLGVKLVDEAFGFTVGWYYVIIWVFTLSSEYNATSSVFQFWSGDKVPLYAYVLMLWFVFSIFQVVMGVGLFGEIEFYLALFKIIGLCAFYIFSIVYCAGGIRGHKAFGFQYWKNPGPFANGFPSFVKCLIFASQFYSGTEIVAITASEAANPSKAVPSAIRQTFWRILLIYVGIALSYGITVPYNDPDLRRDGLLRSPMSIAIARAGWPAGVHLVNAFIIVICISAINSSIYTGSRTVLQLAHEGFAPKFFRKVTKRGIPIPAIMFVNTIGLIAMMNQSTNAANAYSYIINISGVAVFIVWGSVCFYHIRFRQAMKKQNRSIDELVFKGLWYPILPLIGLILNIILTLIQGYSYFKPFQAGDWVDAYILIPFFFLMYFGFKIWKRTKWVHLQDVDLDSGRRQDYYDTSPSNKLKEKLKTNILFKKGKHNDDHDIKLDVGEIESREIEKPSKLKNLHPYRLFRQKSNSELDTF
ncbi:unnamed protein product [Candida verbasci]|uniref:Amino acid permease/ SLC12A domain-containing protein n=1 Tax=Candida verbasci TaxID=1227364 RepID=A0A9W4TUY1_9ASCO|nr:unnamed protein product [Candida verbasci]